MVANPVLDSELMKEKSYHNKLETFCKSSVSFRTDKRKKIPHLTENILNQNRFLKFQSVER